MTRTASLARRRFELMAAEYVARIGERIRTRREELDLTQDEVARRMPGKVTGQRVSLWERGEHQPRADSLEAIALALDVPVSYFLAAAPDKTVTPDLVGTLNGSSEETQLDRIENMLHQVLALLEPAASEPVTQPDRVAQATRETRARRRAGQAARNAKSA